MINREDQDEYAAKSQQKAETAIANGYFDKEIVAVPVTVRKDTTLVSKDEFPKSGTTAQGLGKLRPAFIKVIQSYILFNITIVFFLFSYNFEIW